VNLPSAVNLPSKGIRVGTFANGLAAVVATGMVLLSTPAFAEHHITYKDKVYVQASGKQILVRDDGCDDREVKGKWKYTNLSTAPMHSKNNNAGCRTTVTMITDAMIHQIQACVVRDWLPDSCSPWKSWE
jgi:hypothetical protein